MPHLHEGMEESFFVVDGEFTFTLGEKEIPAGPGSFVLVPRGTKHTFAAAAPGSRVLVLMVPGAARYDSVPQ